MTNEQLHYMQALEVENTRLRSALEPFSEWYKGFALCRDDSKIQNTPLTVGDLRRASDAMKETT